MRQILESSRYLINVCSLFLLQGSRLALCSLREKGGKWNKTEKHSWEGGGGLCCWPFTPGRLSVLQGSNHSRGSGGGGGEDAGGKG